MLYTCESVVHLATLAGLRDLVLMTRHQVKIGVLLGLVGLVAVVVVWLLYRTFARRPPEPVASEPPFDLPESATAPERPRPVDPAVANLLAKASTQPGDTRTTDELVAGALRVVTDLGGVSVPALQRKLELDFAMASKLVERLEADGYVSESGPGGKRKVLPKAFEYVEGLDAQADDD